MWEKARRLMPGGTQLLSKRSERFLPGQWPAFYSRAKGCSIWDLNDRHYYDFAQMGVGSCALGYADDAVNAAVIKAVSDGSMSSLNVPESIELTERLVDLHSYSDMACYTRSGGEAASLAVRIGRATSGKDKVAFCGYHGWHDWYLASNLANEHNLDEQLLPGLNPLGVPKCLSGTAIPFRYNHLDDLIKITNEHDDIGVIIMEPCRSEEPAEGFLEGVRLLADKIGAVLIFDEITSGFRVNLGGIHLTYNVEPDIALFGKALGNGYPICAILGKRSVMEVAENSFISSTFWTEKIGFVAAIATLKQMDNIKAQKFMVRHGENITDIWNSSAKTHGLDIHVGGIAPLTHISFNCDEPLAVMTLYAQEMLDKGYLLGSAVYSTSSYTDEIIEKFGMATDEIFSLISHAIKSESVLSRLKGGIIQTAFKRLA